jgi:hypothetical protein
MTNLELLHRTLHQLLGVIELFEDERNIHFRLARKTLAAAVNAVLPDERERIGQQVERDGEPAAGGAHHRFVALERIVVLIEDAHDDKLATTEDTADTGNSFAPTEMFSSVSTVSSVVASFRIICAASTAAARRGSAGCGSDGAADRR